VGNAAFDERQSLNLDWDQRIAEVYDYLGDHLSPDDFDKFESDVAQATIQTMRTGQSRHLNDVLRAWYRTMLFDRAGAKPSAPDLDEEPMTMDEVRAHLGV
jgi:hypothetical protein